MSTEISRAPSSARTSRWFTEKSFNFVVATAALLIVSIPVGIANIYLGFVLGESPCILCGIERFGMLLIGGLGLMILRYGPHYKYVATLLLAAFFFLYTTIRHWAPHIPEDMGQGFGGAMFGVHTYTWAVLIYWVVIAALAMGMVFVACAPKLLREMSGQERPVKPFSVYHKVVAVIVLVLSVTNAAQSLVTNGPPPFAGMGDPPRFTLDVTKASDHWTMDVYTRLKEPSLHGFTAPMPHIPGVHEDTGLEFSTDPPAGPIAPSAGELQVAERTEIGFPVTGVTDSGTAAGLAHDPSSDLFGLVSTDGGIFYVEDDFETLAASAVLDRVNGNDIQHTVDATFIGPEQLLVTAWNKTLYGVERTEPENVDESEAWAEFRETSGDLTGLFDLKERPRLFTARAKDAYTLSIAGDPTTESYYTVSVPHADQEEPKVVISQFAADNKLSREGVLSVGSTTDTADDVDLAQYYPVGADFEEGSLYLLSKAYQSLLVVDAETLEVTAVHGLPEIGDYHDLVVNQDEVFILSREAGTDVVYELSGLK